MEFSRTMSPTTNFASMGGAGTDAAVAGAAAVVASATAADSGSEAVSGAIAADAFFSGVCAFARKAFISRTRSRIEATHVGDLKGHNLRRILDKAGKEFSSKPVACQPRSFRTVSQWAQSSFAFAATATISVNEMAQSATMIESVFL